MNLRRTRVYTISCVSILGLLIIANYMYSLREIPADYNEQPLIFPHTVASATLDRNKVTPFKGQRIVHLDLKGAPPKVAYYKKIFPLFAKMKITGILIEYEDMFPYAGSIKNISALNAYNLEEIQEINELAFANNLIVIPLIQTFGHMEFILKLKQYKYLREIHEFPQTICPTNNASVPLIVEMASQILKAHPRATMLHIGADEVYHLGKCTRCYETRYKHHWSKHQLFLKHVSRVAKSIHAIKPLRLLVWDDVFRQIELKELIDSKINVLVEPVVWQYNTQVYDDLGPSFWDQYAVIFPRIWIASAFKGATGSNQIVTNINHHVENHRSWLMIVNAYQEKVDFQGIFITGWQRYDHFAILCELLPVALPSLAMCMRLILGHDDSPIKPPKEVAKLLECEQPYGLIGDGMGSPKCFYPGGQLLDEVIKLQNVKHEYLDMLKNSVFVGWMNNYNVRHVFSNPDLIQTAMSPLDSMKMELAQIQASIIGIMTDIYDNYTIDEWIQSHIQPLETQIVSLWEKKELLLSKTSWPQRPLTDL